MTIQREIKITDLIGCTVSVALLLIASAWIPYVGPFFSLLIPLPFLFYASKLGSNKGAQASAVSLIIIGLVAGLAGHSYIILFCLEFALLGFIISEVFRREFSFGLAIFWGTSSMLIVGAIFLFLVGLSKGMGPIEMILDYFKANLGNTALLYENMELDQESAAQMEQVLQMLSELITKAFPALLVVGTGLVVWINVVISKPIFRIAAIKYPEFGRLDQWHAPEAMVWGVIASGFSLFLPIPIMKLAALNALIVLTLIYVFHGLSIILYIFNRFRVPGWARIIIYLIMLVQQVFLFVLALAGLFDQWVDFRKIHRKKADTL